jgi:hypothetical protein
MWFEYLVLTSPVPRQRGVLAVKAVEQGILFAKEIGAKITVVTVTEPLDLLYRHRRAFALGHGVAGDCCTDP